MLLAIRDVCVSKIAHRVFHVLGDHAPMGSVEGRSYKVIGIMNRGGDLGRGGGVRIGSTIFIWIVESAQS